jgi:hypothetical protein
MPQVRDRQGAEDDLQSHGMAYKRQQLQVISAGIVTASAMRSRVLDTDPVNGDLLTAVMLWAVLSDCAHLAALEARCQVAFFRIDLSDACGGSRSHALYV